MATRNSINVMYRKTVGIPQVLTMSFKTWVECIAFHEQLEKDHEYYELIRVTGGRTHEGS